jgi:hypothetical protein
LQNMSSGLRDNLSNRSFLVLFLGFFLLMTGCVRGGGGGGGGGGTGATHLNSISISPTNVSLTIAATASLKASGVYSDGSTLDITTQVVWSSDAPDVVSVGVNTGVLTANLAGAATITAALSGVTSTVPASITVSPTGGIAASSNTLTDARYEHVTSVLITTGTNAGKVLVVGGFGVTSDSIPMNPLGSAELYDPVLKTWSPAAALNEARGDHTSVTLLDGRVLVTGGVNNTSPGLISTELYDPSQSSPVWSYTGELTTGRSYNSITLLTTTGQVLVAGGVDISGEINTAELYTPAPYPSVSGTWASAGTMLMARYSHSATFLTTGPNAGKVLVAGGFNAAYTNGLASCELYDPITNQWSAAANLKSGPRYDHSATKFTTGPFAGKVLVVGGYGPAASPVLATAEMYDPVNDTWTQVGSLTIPRVTHTAVLIPADAMHASGQVLVMGGSDDFGNALSSTELYDPVTGIWTTTSSFLTARQTFTATYIPYNPLTPQYSNGSVLAVGGYGNTSLHNSSELYWW